MNKCVVVSGGTKGIGKAIIEKFASEGYDVITCSRNRAELEDLKGNLSTRFPEIESFVFQADLSKSEETLSFVKFIKENRPKVDVLVNNAGVFIPGEIHNEADGMLEMMINTNLYSAYHLSRGVIPEMKENRTGDIFNICSVASMKAYPNGGSYSISKFAMHGMSQGLRDELKSFGIRVVSVLPGATYTDSWGSSDLPEERFMKASDIAESIWGVHTLSRQSVVEDLVIRPLLGDI